jgi:hypothetical protein
VQGSQDTWGWYFGLSILVTTRPGKHTFPVKVVAYVYSATDFILLGFEAHHQFPITAMWSSLQLDGCQFAWCTVSHYFFVKRSTFQRHFLQLYVNFSFEQANK